MKLKFVLPIILFFLSISVKADDGFKIVVGIFDLKDAEVQKFIEDLKKVLPKSISSNTQDTDFSSDKMLVLEVFKTEKEANAFNDKLKIDFQKFAEASYVSAIGKKNEKSKVGVEGVGPFGMRTNAGRENAIQQFGGSKETENSVEFALSWLASVQEKEGSWDPGKFNGSDSSEVACATTSLALLAMLGAGNTDKEGLYKVNVKSAILWLIKNQKPDGSWDNRNYANGICTYALAEAAVMGCVGQETKKATILAVSYLLKEQNDSGFFDYTGPSRRDDMSATAWCLMGLKSAMLAGIKEKEIKEVFKKCGDFLDKTGGTKDNTATSKGLGWYTPENVGTGDSGGACQAIAILIRQQLGWKKSAPWMHAAVNGQISKIPTSFSKMETYRNYYTYLTLFQHGGMHWNIWNNSVTKIIVSAQRKDGDLKGSWDSTGGHTNKGGRILETALCCLCLETYYRYRLAVKD